MLKLIYHNEENLKRGISPFDEAIVELVKDNSIKIACPYISSSYFKRITKLSNGNWLLLTDVNALFSSQRGKIEREEIKSFISKNKEKVKHCDNLHAKAIITQNKAFFGSCNFTLSGITRNNELSVLIDDKENVDKLEGWFEEWWSKSKMIEEVDLNKFLLNTYKSDYSKENFTLESNDTKLSCQLSSLPTKTQAKGTLTKEKLANLFAKWRDLAWANAYLDLTKELIDEFKLNDFDKRFAITKPKAELEINFIIGSRIILSPFYENSKFGVGLIMDLSYKLDNMNKDFVLKRSQDRVFNGKGGYRRKGKLDAYWLVFNREQGLEFSKDIKLFWKKAICQELEQTKSSRYRANHEPIIYKAAINLEYRKEVLDLANSKMKRNK